MTDQVQLSKIIRKWMDTFMHRSMRGWSHHVKATGMSMPQFSILMQLHYRGSCGISEISERFEVSNAAASQLVERLVQSGLIERAEDPDDRRAKLIKLSSKGKKLIESGIEQRYRWVDELVSNLNAEERTKVGAALTMLTEAAAKLEQTQ
ncbi:MAG: MarR family transcriptional regulator [Chloroflexi bacterium]|nr:MarR family transcriptional regulator [Chloroflexota bacterium]